MFAKVLNLFRKPKPANNVLHLETIRCRHFFNVSARAVRAQGLRGQYEARAINHAKKVWQKHRDRVQGYEMPIDAERAMLDYIDLQAKYQRNDNKPAPDRPWSPKAVA